MKKYIFNLSILLSLLLLFSCNANRTVKGGVIGSTAGGILGGIIAKKGSRATGVLIGASIGGAAGAVIGRYMDKQAEEIESEVEGVNVKREGEGILLTFDSGLMFGFDSYDLRTETKNNLTRLTSILKKYPDTEILVQGHTDSKGSETYNQELSEKRANAVSKFLMGNGVTPSRLITIGKGEMDPTTTNETEEGRQKNRRVELVIVADEKLRKEAQDGKLSVN